jgi:hypothetical protein
MCTLRAVTLILSIAAASPALHADSDGYYCVGRDYLAYQLGLAAPPLASHRLYVVRLAGEQAMSAPAVIDIPQFQVHGMLCDQTSIELESFDGIYKVHLDSGRRPARYEFTRWPDPQHRLSLSPGGSPRIGGYGFFTKGLAPVRTALLKDPLGHQFAIEIEPQLSNSRLCETHITTRLIEVDPSNSVIRQQVLYTGTGYLENCQ